MSRPAQFVVKKDDGRYATKSAWVNNPKHASKHISRYQAKRWAERYHSNCNWTVEILHHKDFADVGELVDPPDLKSGSV